jgi:hypothetical protein
MQKKYTYHYVLQVLRPAFKILAFRDVSLDGRFELFKPAIQRNNNAVETSNSAAVTFLI